ncbi:hypothetical protein ACP70R_041301 [Stipagrostis hirtigluma subsp. patula]
MRDKVTSDAARVATVELATSAAAMGSVSFPGGAVGVMSLSAPEDEAEEAAAMTTVTRALWSSSPPYRGVVPQPNGRWGAQIYDRPERVWLGTFADEDAAARAYDVAALRFRGRGAAVNFPGTATAAELAFLAARPKAEVVDMLRKHTYDDELRNALRSGGGRALAPVTRVALFEKVLAPSDVRRPNRLLLPKLHAERHFPPPGEHDDDDAAPVLLTF